MHPASQSICRFAAVVIALSACTSGQKASSDTASAAGAAALRSTPADVAATLPGALTKPLAQYSPQELRALTRRLVFTGGVERDRRCKGAAACGSARSVTRLRIDAVEGEDSISAGALPTNGVIAARLLNRGAFTDAMYGTAAGANHEYYLIVLPGSKAGAAIWRLEEIGLTGKQLTHRTVGTGTFRECHHRFEHGARADFKTCEEAALIHNAAFVMPQTTDSPLWFACASGCCTADPGGT